MSRIILAFDLYGTLLSTTSISEALAQNCGVKLAEAVAIVWRKYQLEYTWRLNSMRQYEDFEVVTKKSFLHALSEHGLEMDAGAIDSVMRAYDSLAAFEDVVPALKKLKEISNVECVIFSNGTKRMIESSVRGPKELAQFSNFFTQLISVHDVMSYKPAPEVYRYLGHCVDVAEGEQIWLVSSNPFDVVGARATGMNAVWVDRAGKGWQDALGLQPTIIVRGLEGLGDVVEG